ncbi:putative G protein alpha subunit [Lyophyllum shimeji]|uniref:G protein alpha subunit n=1 Tax=Lyophyllum shimeji TaxID=47721 RepID=A0A9P3PMV3_LYOSH|nr:putative G protein alpha subunit [Lyophyllum shimeji]
MPKVRTQVATPVWPPPLPPDESEEARAARIAEEEEAKRVSDSIDRSLGAEREQRKRGPRVKILLLGQAESGKSTILKNFQLHFSPKAFESEAEIWRPIIHLNLVRSINFIVNFLQSAPRDFSSHQPLYNSLSGELRRLCIGLAPLREVEASLTRGISGASSSPINTDAPAYNPAKASEVAVRASTGWKGLLLGRKQAEGGSSVGKADDANRRILAACAEDMTRLWKDPVVKKALRSREISLQDQPGFFLEDIDRITRADYIPSPDDILRARVTTIGPEEHYINVERGSDTSKSWLIYDVGGSRSQRAAWAQYFDDVNIIIFLAPLSGFNQVLAEDATVNRLSDSLKLWRMICSNKLLASVELILFLNKLDILNAKLEAGIQFSNYVKAYAGKPNDTKSVAKWDAEGCRVRREPRGRSPDIYPPSVDDESVLCVLQLIQRQPLVLLHWIPSPFHEVLGLPSRNPAVQNLLDLLFDMPINKFGGWQVLRCGVSRYVRRQLGNMEYWVDLPFGWEFQSIGALSNLCDDFKWPKSSVFELLGRSIRLQVFAFKPDLVSWAEVSAFKGCNCLLPQLLHTLCELLCSFDCCPPFRLKALAWMASPIEIKGGVTATPTSRFAGNLRRCEDIGLDIEEAEVLPDTITKQACDTLGRNGGVRGS